MDLWTTGLDTIRVDMTWTIYWTGGFRITEMVLVHNSYCQINIF